ncbi:MAG: hypothetical protein HC855_12280 [Rhizobiales bacterium]|nr:hypothetical protein [Hyphomicrobiales bacterium]
MNDMTSATAVRSDASPMMAQYLEIKAANPDCLLFYRMGDFYELFFADAETASRALGIALTKRGKHGGGDIPMCGVPVHAADGYLQRLIRLGHRVAVCEQMEDAAEARRRGSKSVVRRDVVRLVTPGTLTEDALLESRSHNYLAALARLKGIDEWALAWTDISSGDMVVQPVTPLGLSSALARLQPSELLHPDSLLDDAEASGLLKSSATVLTPLPSVRFDSASAERRLKQHYGVAALEAFGSFGKAEVAALGALLDYVQATQAGKAPLSPLRSRRGMTPPLPWRLTRQRAPILNWCAPLRANAKEVCSPPSTGPKPPPEAVFSRAASPRLGRSQGNRRAARRSLLLP